jgi:hypothetical protein
MIFTTLTPSPFVYKENILKNYENIPFTVSGRIWRFSSLKDKLVSIKVFQTPPHYSIV